MVRPAVAADVEPIFRFKAVLDSYVWQPPSDPEPSAVSMEAGFGACAPGARSVCGAQH